MRQLVGFLLERIEEDRAAAEAAIQATGDDDAGAEEPGRWVWARIAANSSRYAHGAPSPTRVLAECRSKRQLLSMTLERLDVIMDGRATLEDAAEIRWLAAPYANHPEYQPGWAP